MFSATAVTPNGQPRLLDTGLQERQPRIYFGDLPAKSPGWVLVDTRRAEIDAHFAVQQRNKPQLWNGRVLLARDPDFSGEHFSASYFETDFASFLAWRDWGFIDKSVFNGPGMGALRGNDGAFVLGEMAAHTANAGRIYFAAGTPDLDDLRDGIVDIAGSVAREVEEETGLTPADYRADPHWDMVVMEGIIAMIRRLDVALTGEALRHRIEANLARLPKLLHTDADVTALVAAWQQLAPLLTGKPSGTVVQQADDAAEALLALSEQLTNAIEAAGAGKPLRLVNLCGRQRMLSQRLAKEALLGDLLPGRDPAPLSELLQGFEAGLVEPHELA